MVGQKEKEEDGILPCGFVFFVLFGLLLFFLFFFLSFFSLLPFGFFVVLFKFEEKKEELVFSAAAQKVPNRRKGSVEGL